MNLLFKYRWNHHEPVYGHQPYLVTKIELPDASEETCWSFRKYLLSSLDTDFPTHHPEWIDEVLSEIEKLELGEIDVTYWGGDPGFEQTITREGVTFEHGTFGECPEWPLCTCSLAQYKAALQGWRRFIDMPKSVETELIVDLPE